MSLTNDSGFAEQIARIMVVAGAQTQPELAEYLGVSLSAVEDAAQSGKIPADWLLVLLRVNNASPDWILAGQGPRFMGRPLDRYETGEEAVERWGAIEALRRVPSRLLADELVRRIVVAQSQALSKLAEDADGLGR